MRVWVCVIALVFAVAGPAAASTRPYDPSWRYLVEQLANDGFDAAQVQALFADPRVDPFQGLAFSLYPREHQSLYRGFRRADSVRRARACHAEHARALRAAERRYGVPASVVTAILHVETQCGRNTGGRLVLVQVAKLAMANDPANLRWNIARHTAGVHRQRHAAIAARVRRRARELEEMFYPEVVAALRLASRNAIDPLAVRGSSAGAFGLPQFLPSSYLRFAVDGNGDGRVSLYDAGDAIASTANYLQGHGWREPMSRAERRRVIWSYNHSDAYIDTVLYLAAQIDQTSEERRVMSGRRSGAIRGKR
jgi:membrane-bound lytic murein transglycosylase B